MSTHSYRVRKRRMCQAIGLRADLTTMAQLREAWAAKGLRWPDDTDVIDNDHPVNIDDYKETEMTTAKKNAQTATTKTTTNKETTMTNETPLTGKEKRAADLAALKAKFDAPAFTTVINFHNVLKAQYVADHGGEDKAPKGIYATDDEIEYLCWFAREMGWTNNAFCSKTQVANVHGTVREGAVGVKLYPAKGRPGTYFNYDDIIWENGEGPVYDPEVDAATHKGYSERRKTVTKEQKQRQIQKELVSGVRTIKAVIDGVTYEGTLDEILALKAALSA